MTKECIGAQGEITIYRISELPANAVPAKIGRTATGAILSHSESGAHHVLTGGAEVLERPDAPPGMQILYALLDGPQTLVQDAAVPHGSHDLPPGIYEFRIAREHDHFSEMARRVAD
jgi:hypothetical protein